jgi:formylglycine-generating enzyme required for sulfatase activity
MPRFTEVESRIIQKYISDPSLSDSLADIHKVMESIWRSDVRIVKNYTDHGMEHSIRIAGFVEKLLEVNPSVKFSEQEIYLLLAGIYLHDIGMQCDVIKYPEIKNKAKKLGAKFDVLFTAETANDYLPEQRDAIRENHHYLSAAWIDYLYEGNDPALSNFMQSIPDDLVDDLIDICKFHSKLPINNCPDSFIHHPNNRKKLVAALLRFADELDISSSRVDLKTVKLFTIKPDNSVYWWLHNYTNINFIETNKIRVTVRLHPKDFESYGYFIREDYITKFKNKNQPVLDVLVGQNIPLVIDYNSDVIAHKRAEKFPPEISAFFEKKRKIPECDERNKKQEKNSKTPLIFISPSTGMEFVLVTAGKFMMGSHAKDQYSHQCEYPAHEVTIKNSFYIGKYPVTQKQWEKIMGSNPSHFKGENLPVESVSWVDVQQFVTKINEQEKINGYCLPSEAEWEYACRAGTQTKYFFGNDESKLYEYAWFNKNSEGKTHQVGQKKPNQYGLYDIYGNVCEWVQDEWNDNYNISPSDNIAWEEGEDSCRVTRGGSWDSDFGLCRSADRCRFDPTHYRIYIGFRLMIEENVAIKKAEKNLNVNNDT